MRSLRHLVAAAVLVFASTALAQSYPAHSGFRPSSYVQLRLGFYSPESSDLDGFDRGVAIDGAYGYRFSPNLAGEIGLGYFRTTASASGGGFAADVTLSDVPITVTVKAIAPLGAVELYGAVGLGLHSVSISASASGIGSGSDSTTALGVHLGGGINVPVSPVVSLGLDLRYVIAKADFSGGSVNIDGLLVTGALLYKF
jgi:opacity protein-like surface antigen